jgi:hypothetical protein
MRVIKALLPRAFQGWRGELLLPVLEPVLQKAENTLICSGVRNVSAPSRRANVEAICLDIHY